MSKLTIAHYELARIIRWEARNLSGVYSELDYEVDASIKHYHRNDGYRVISITADNKRFLKELSKIIRDWLDKSALCVRIFLDIRNARKESEFILDFSIWKCIRESDKLEIHTENLS